MLFDFDFNEWNSPFWFQCEINKALDKVCTIIPVGKIRKKCRNSIKAHGEEMADKIAENLNARKIYQVLALCWTVMICFNWPYFSSAQFFLEISNVKKPKSVNIKHIIKMC